MCLPIKLWLNIDQTRHPIQRCTPCVLHAVQRCNTIWSVGFQTFFSCFFLSNWCLHWNVWSLQFALIRHFGYFWEFFAVMIVGLLLVDIVCGLSSVCLADFSILYSSHILYNLKSQIGEELQIAICINWYISIKSWHSVVTSWLMADTTGTMNYPFDRGRLKSDSLHNRISRSDFVFWF